MSEAIEILELKIAYLERTSAELSDVIYRQQQEIDALRLQVQAVLARVDSMKVEPAPWTEEEERPPHY